MSASRDDLDAIFGALADPTRRRLLERLRDGGARVTDLADPLPISLNAVSKHVKVLERAGLVRRDVVGREHRISLEPTPLLDALDWIARYESFWTERIDALEAYLARVRKTETEAAAGASPDADRAMRRGGADDVRHAGRWAGDRSLGEETDR